MTRTLSILLGALAALCLAALSLGCDVVLDDGVETTSSALVVDFDRAAPDLAVTTEIEVAIPATPSRAPTAVQTRNYVETILIHFFSELDEPPGPCPSPDRFVIRAAGVGVDPVEVEVVVPDGGEAVVALPVSGDCASTPCVLTFVRDAGEAGPVTVVIERR